MTKWKRTRRVGQGSSFLSYHGICSKEYQRDMQNANTARRPYDMPSSHPTTISHPLALALNHKYVSNGSITL